MTHKYLLILLLIAFGCIRNSENKGESGLITTIPRNPSMAINQSWQKLDQSLWIREWIIQPEKYSQKEITAHLFKFHPSEYKLKVLTASQYQERSLSITDYVQKSSSIMAINGHFFKGSMELLGLYVSDGKHFPSASKNTWYIFSISGNKSTISKVEAFSNQVQADFAIQSYPLLVYEGDPKTLNNTPDRRSFIGSTKEGEVILGILSKGQLGLGDLAALMAKEENFGGAGLYYALNLDGGSSSQLNIDHQRFTEVIFGGVKVPGAIGLFRK